MQMPLGVLVRLWLLNAAGPLGCFHFDTLRGSGTTARAPSTKTSVRNLLLDFTLHAGRTSVDSRRTLINRLPGASATMRVENVFLYGVAGVGMFLLLFASRYFCLLQRTAAGPATRTNVDLGAIARTFFFLTVHFQPRFMAFPSFIFFFFRVLGWFFNWQENLLFCHLYIHEYNHPPKG